MSTIQTCGEAERQSASRLEQLEADSPVDSWCACAFFGLRWMRQRVAHALMQD